jgi:hypothetical protein
MTISVNRRPASSAVDAAFQSHGEMHPSMPSCGEILRELEASQRRRDDGLRLCYPRSQDIASRGVRTSVREEAVQRLFAPSMSSYTAGCQPSAKSAAMDKLKCVASILPQSTKTLSYDAHSCCCLRCDVARLSLSSESLHRRWSLTAEHEKAGQDTGLVPYIFEGPLLDDAHTHAEGPVVIS